MADDGGWAVVGKKGKARKRRRQDPAAGAAAADDGTAHMTASSVVPDSLRAAPSAARLAWFEKNIDEAQNHIRASAFGASLEAAFTSAQQRIAANPPSPATASGHPNSATEGAAGATGILDHRDADASSPSVGAAPAASGWSFLSRYRRLVVYGLGPLEGQTSRYQLALALILRARMRELGDARMEVYDPAHSAADVAFLEHLGARVLDDNAGGGYNTGEPTFFWMAHCDHEVANACVAAHAEAGALPRIAILGNSFANIVERWSTPGFARRMTRARPDALLRLVEDGAVCEAAVPDRGFPLISAFNDLGLHWFRPAR